MNIEIVLEEYRKGDEAKRISLFMTYRDLRDEFTRIEQDRPDEFEFIRFPWSRKRRAITAA